VAGEIIMRTEKDICTLCYDIQDACNFMPVVNELSRTLQDLKTAGIEHNKLNAHPAVIILIDKINDMMYRPDLTKVMDSFTYCREMKNKIAPIIEVN
jgi:hypothetical protein